MVRRGPVPSKWELLLFPFRRGIIAHEKEVWGDKFVVVGCQTGRLADHFGRVIIGREGGNLWGGLDRREFGDVVRASAKWDIEVVLTETLARRGQSSRNSSHVSLSRWLFEDQKRWSSFRFSFQLRQIIHSKRKLHRRHYR